MHEHGLADHILQAILERPERPTQALPKRVVVLVSEFAGLSQAALQAQLDHVCAHEGLPSIELILETTPFLVACEACGSLAPLEEFPEACPTCGHEALRFCGGETVLIQSCEYEAQGPAIGPNSSELEGK